MLKIENLKLNNFVTYKEQFFDFSKIFEKENIVLISGKNFDDSSFANDNGAGKSLIYEAILFSLFNRTTKNTSKDLLVGKHKKGMSVELTLNDERHEYIIKRFRKDNKYGNDVLFYIDGKIKSKSTATDTNQLILRALGLTYQRVINTSIFESNDERSRFVYLKDKAAKDLLMHMKGYEIFSLCYKIAFDESSSLNREIEQLNRELQLLTKKLEDLRQTKRDVLKQIKKERLQQQKKITEIKKLIKETTDKERSKKEEIKQKITNIKNSVKKIEKKLINQEKIDKIYEKLRASDETASSYDKISKEKKFELWRLQDLEKKLKNSEANVGQRCEHCGSIIKKENIQIHIKSIRDKEKILEKEIKKYDAKTSLFSEKTRKYTIKADKATKNNLTINQKIEKLSFKKTQLENEISNLKETTNLIVKNLRKQLRLSKSMEAKYSNNVLLNLNKKIKNVKENIANLQKAIRTKQISSKYAKAWAYGFSKEAIQAFALKSTIEQFNDNIESITESLTDGMIQIRLLTEKIQKNKSVRNIFELEIQDLNKKGLPFKEWSKGQKKRIEIITNFALMSLEKNLIAEVFLDELFDGIDKIGIIKIIDFLRSPKNSARNFIILSHISEIKNLFSNQGVVTLKNGISSFTIK